MNISAWLHRNCRLYLVGNYRFIIGSQVVDSFTCKLQKFMNLHIHRCRKQVKYNYFKLFKIVFLNLYLEIQITVIGFPI